LAALFALPACFVGLDLFIDKHAVFLEWSALQWGVWATGFAWDLSAWISFLVLLVWIRSRPGKTPRSLFRGLVAFDAAALSFATALSAGYREVFYHLPNVHALEFAIVEWRNAWSMVQDGFTPWAVVWFAVSIPALAGLHLLGIGAWSRLTRSALGWKRVAFAAVPVVCLGAISPFALGWHRFQEPLPLLANWSRVFFQYGLMMTGNRTNLQRPNRIELAAPAAPVPCNVLIVLHESLRSDAFHPGQNLLDSLDPGALAPRTSGFLADSLVVAFPHGRSNSSSTSVSVPSLLTGVAPHSSTFRFHRSPSVFQAAKAAGMRTFLVTSQDWRWEHLDQYYFGSLDRVVHRPDWDIPRNNDLGVDDALTLDSLSKVLAETKGPFLGVWQLNSNHNPFYPGPDRTDLPLAGRERYQASVRYVDSIQGVGLERLRRSGLLENTLVIMVSDHGENIGARKIGRINSFFDETIRIPFAIRVPERLAATPAGQILRRNLLAWASRDVQLLDVAPTIYDLLGILDQPRVRQFLDGASLLREPAGPRTIIGQNTGDIRSWDIEGGYVLRDGVKFVFSSGAKGGLFDLRTDPQETNDLWDSVPFREAQLPWLREAFQIPGVAAVCQRSHAACPEPIHQSLPKPATKVAEGKPEPSKTP